MQFGGSSQRCLVIYWTSCKLSLSMALKCGFSGVDKGVQHMMHLIPNLPSEGSQSLGSYRVNSKIMGRQYSLMLMKALSWEFQLMHCKCDGHHDEFCACSWSTRGLTYKPSCHILIISLCNFNCPTLIRDGSTKIKSSPDRLLISLYPQVYRGPS